MRKRKDFKREPGPLARPSSKPWKNELSSSPRYSWLDVTTQKSTVLGLALLFGCSTNSAKKSKWLLELSELRSLNQPLVKAAVLGIGGLTIGRLYALSLRY
jgi:hypothetical protein